MRKLKKISHGEYYVEEWPNKNTGEDWDGKDERQGQWEGRESSGGPGEQEYPVSQTKGERPAKSLPPSGGEGHTTTTQSFGRDPSPLCRPIEVPGPKANAWVSPRCAHLRNTERRGRIVRGGGNADEWWCRLRPEDESTFILKKNGTQKIYTFIKFHVLNFL